MKQQIYKEITLDFCSCLLPHFACYWDAIAIEIYKRLEYNIKDVLVFLTFLRSNHSELPEKKILPKFKNRLIRSRIHSSKRKKLLKMISSSEVFLEPCQQ